jgi:light-regulated signal transduction histidine kinase (bacteriophytochrome)
MFGKGVSRAGGFLFLKSAFFRSKSFFDTRFMSATSDDISERKRLEQELKEKDAALEAVRHEFQSFSHSIAHDLRAPLRAINGFSNILKKSLRENISEESAFALARVQDNASKMTKMIDALLDFSSLSWATLTKKAINPADVVKNSFAGLIVLNERRNIDFSVGELPACRADANLLRRLIDNLLSNAIKFTRKSDPAVIHVGSQQDNGVPVYFIQDNGAGFDMEYAGKLFEAFQRLHSASEFEGAGMGLAVARRIVQRHGGRIWAQGEVDRGATFYFTLADMGYGHSTECIDR